MRKVVKELPFWLVTLFLSFGLGIIFVFLWVGGESDTRTTDEPLKEAESVTNIQLKDSCSEVRSFPGLSKELSDFEGKKGGFFPEGIFSNGKKFSHEFKSVVFSASLEAMGEKSFIASSENTKIEGYRFLWLRSFHNPMFIRIERVEDTINLTMKEFDRKEDGQPRTVISESKKEIDRDQWCKFIELIDKADYWRLVPNSGSTGFDGSMWLLEGVKSGRYHAVSRWSPQKGSYRDAGVFLLKLAGFFDRDTHELY